MSLPSDLYVEILPLKGMVLEKGVGMGGAVVSQLSVTVTKHLRNQLEKKRTGLHWFLFSEVSVPWLQGCGESEHHGGRNMCLKMSGRVR